MRADSAYRLPTNEFDRLEARRPRQPGRLSSTRAAGLEAGRMRVMDRLLEEGHGRPARGYDWLTGGPPVPLLTRTDYENNFVEKTT